MSDGLAAILAGLKQNNGAGEGMSLLPQDIQARVLKDHLSKFEPLNLKVGHLVQLRNEFDVYSRPRDGCLSIVIEILEDTVSQGLDGNCAYFRNDCVIMTIDTCGFAMFAVYSRFFKKYEGSVA